MNNYDELMIRQHKDASEHVIGKPIVLEINLGDHTMLKAIVVIHIEIYEADTLLLGGVYSWIREIV